MEKVRRNERMSVLMKLMADSPNTVHSLGEFGALFGSAKSTMSEDVELLRKTVEAFELGQVDTVTGAAGGVIYRPKISQEKALKTIQELCGMLSGTERLLPGGYLYYADILSTPGIVNRMGEILATAYFRVEPDFVLTMETKGIPVAFATANALGVPLVIARHSSKVYEGSAVNINYVSGSGKMETMSLSRRAVWGKRRALIVDDFLRGGGTARGMVELMKEFNVMIMGMSFVMSTAIPRKKRVTGARSLMTLTVSMTEGEPPTALVEPADWLLSGDILKAPMPIGGWLT